MSISQITQGAASTTGSISDSFALSLQKAAVAAAPTTTSTTTSKASTLKTQAGKTVDPWAFDQNYSRQRTELMIAEAEKAIEQVKKEFFAFAKKVSKLNNANIAIQSTGESFTNQASSWIKAAILDVHRAKSLLGDSNRLIFLLDRESKRAESQIFSRRAMYDLNNARLMLSWGETMVNSLLSMK